MCTTANESIFGSRAKHFLPFYYSKPCASCARRQVPEKFVCVSAATISSLPLRFLFSISFFSFHRSLYLPTAGSYAERDEARRGESRDSLKIKIGKDFSRRQFFVRPRCAAVVIVFHLILLDAAECNLPQRSRLTSVSFTVYRWPSLYPCFLLRFFFQRSLALSLTLSRHSASIHFVLTSIKMYFFVVFVCTRFRFLLRWIRTLHYYSVVCASARMRHTMMAVHAHIQNCPA